MNSPRNILLEKTDCSESVAELGFSPTSFSSSTPLVVSIGISASRAPSIVGRVVVAVGGSTHPIKISGFGGIGSTRVHPIISTTRRSDGELVDGGRLSGASLGGMAN